MYIYIYIVWYSGVISLWREDGSKVNMTFTTVSTRRDPAPCSMKNPIPTIWRRKTMPQKRKYHDGVGGFSPPLWKIWLRQLGLWHSQFPIYGKITFKVPNHQPDDHDFDPYSVHWPYNCHKASNISNGHKVKIRPHGWLSDHHRP